MMRVPLMQQEWQRRQRQRSVWALLGLLAAVSATGAQPASLAEPCRLAALTATADALVDPVTPARRAPRRSATAARYWQALAAERDGQIRRRLGLHAEPRPVASIRARWLRRFLRPPTPAPC